ncbi:hypothetical protein Tco_1231332 [Tanacetum coccineum]
MDLKILLMGFSGEHSWPFREVPLEITIGDSPFARTEGKDKKKLREASPETTKDVLSCMDAKEKMIVNDRYPKKKVIIGKQLPTNFKEKLRVLLRSNVDIFAWTNANMIGISRTIMKRELGPDHSNTACKEVEELMKAGILQRIKKQTWISNHVMVKKSDREHDIEFRGSNPNQKQIPKDFFIEMPPKEDKRVAARKIDTKKENSKLDNILKLHTHGASSSDGSAQSQEKDTVIRNLKERIKSLSKNVNDDNVKKDMYEIETLNIKLDHMEKGLVITTLKNDLRKLKGKALVNNGITKHIIDLDMLKIDMEPIAPKLLNNKITYSDYLKHTQEQDAILKEVVEQGKSQNPLNNSLDSACKYTKRIQELLIIIRQTCLSINNSGDKLVVVTPQNKDKRVRFTELVTSLGNKTTKTNSSSNLVSNRPVLSSIEVNQSTSASGSQPSGNTKKHKIQRPPSKMFTQTGYIWRPTGRTFTIVGNACPLNRITTTTEVPPRKPNSLVTDTPKPIVTLVYSRKPRKSKIHDPVSKLKIIKSLSANNKEPSKSWGSTISDVPSSSLNE